MITIPRLDINIAYACNISCAGCISLSNFPRKGIVSFADIESDIQYWHPIILPQVVTLFGGEPTIHPQLLDICRCIKQYWPNCILRLITNGYFLHKHNPCSWFGLGKLEIQVSLHRQDHEKIINKNIQEILSYKKPWRVSKLQSSTEHEQFSWTHNDVKIYKSIFAEFIEPYKITDGKIQPHNSDPQHAHAICGAPATPILYRGKLYKCPAVANIIDYSGENWYDYQACSGSNTIAEFVDNIGIPEPVCSGCPSGDVAVRINHFNKDNVIVKNLD